MSFVGRFVSAAANSIVRLYGAKAQIERRVKKPKFLSIGEA